MKKDAVRCIRLQKDQLLELLWACYRGMGYKGLKLPRWGLRFGTVRTGWDYDGETGQMTFFAYRAGAEAALAIARENGCTLAVLKARSPSCGCGEVYDGTFTHTLKGGWGVTARLLREAGLAVMDEENMDSRLFLPEVRD